MACYMWHRIVTPLETYIVLFSLFANASIFFWYRKDNLKGKMSGVGRVTENLKRLKMFLISEENLE